MRRDGRLTPWARLVHAEIASYQLHYGRAFPSVVTLADALGTSPTTIKRATAELIRCGHLVRIKRRGSNLYRIPYLDVEPASASCPSAKRDHPRTQEGPPVVREEGPPVVREEGPPVVREVEELEREEPNHHHPRARGAFAETVPAPEVVVVDDEVSEERTDDVALIDSVAADAEHALAEVISRQGVRAQKNLQLKRSRLVPLIARVLARGWTIGDVVEAGRDLGDPEIRSAVAVFEHRLEELRNGDPGPITPCVPETWHVLKAIGVGVTDPHEREPQQRALNLADLHAVAKPEPDVVEEDDSPRMSRDERFAQVRETMRAARARASGAVAR